MVKEYNFKKKKKIKGVFKFQEEVIYKDGTDRDSRDTEDKE